MDFDNETYLEGLVTELETNMTSVSTMVSTIKRMFPIIDGEDNSSAYASREARIEVMIDSLLKSEARFIERFRREL